MWAGDRASRWLGMELVDVGPGTATLQLKLTDEMVNGHDIGHGGITFTLADSAFAFACNSHNRITVAASAEIRVPPAHEARGSPRRQGGRARPRRAGRTVRRDGHRRRRHRGRVRRTQPRDRRRTLLAAAPHPPGDHGDDDDGDHGDDPLRFHAATVSRVTAELKPKMAPSTPCAATS